MPRGAHSLSPQALYGSASDVPQKRARHSAGPSLFLLLLSRTEMALLLSALLLSDQHDRRDSPRDNDDAGDDDARDRAGGQPAVRVFRSVFFPFRTGVRLRLDGDRKGRRHATVADRHRLRS